MHLSAKTMLGGAAKSRFALQRVASRPTFLAAMQPSRNISLLMNDQFLDEDQKMI